MDWQGVWNQPSNFVNKALYNFIIIKFTVNPTAPADYLPFCRCCTSCVDEATRPFPPTRRATWRPVWTPPTWRRRPRRAINWKKPLTRQSYWHWGGSTSSASGGDSAVYSFKSFRCTYNWSLWGLRRPVPSKSWPWRNVQSALWLARMPTTSAPIRLPLVGHA